MWTASLSQENRSRLSSKLTLWTPTSEGTAGLLTGAITTTCAAQRIPRSRSMERRVDIECLALKEGLQAFLGKLFWAHSGAHHYEHADSRHRTFANRLVSEKNESQPVNKPHSRDDVRTALRSFLIYILPPFRPVPGPESKLHSGMATRTSCHTSASFSDNCRSFHM